jgi:hypothetical protein
MTWLKRILIGLVIFLTVVVGAVAYLVDRMQQPTESHPLSGAWVAEYHAAWNPDGKPWTALARRRSGWRGGTREIVKRVLKYRDLGDDCVVFTTYGRGFYVVCGDRPPVLLGTAGHFAMSGDLITMDEKALSSMELKRAGLATVTAIGGHWSAQQELPLAGLEGEHVLFYKGYLQFVDAVAVHRYLGDDCVLFIYPSRYAGVQCGGRASVPLGKVDDGGSLEADPLPIGGRSLSQQELLRIGRAAEEQESHQW